MKSLLSVTTAALLCSVSAFAADLPSKKSAAAVPVLAAYNWGGAYVGVHAGWGMGGFKQLDDLATETKAEVNRLLGNVITFNSSSPNGFVGGGYAGYNIQSNQLVMGLEADINFANIDRKHSASASLSGNGHTLAGTVYVSQKYQTGGSLRARAGYAFDNVLPFITAGVAIGSNKAGIGGTALYDGSAFVAGSYDKSKTQYGFVVGGGLDYAFTKNIVGRVEYLYTKFDKAEFGEPSNDLVGSIKAGTTLSQIRAGVAYKF